MTAQRRRRALAWLAALVLSWPLLGPARAQELEFRLPAGAREEHIAAALRDLAQRVLPVYQENQAERYLESLSALQLVAGELDAADATRQSLARRRQGNGDARVPGGAGVFDIYVHARALQAREHIDFERAFAQAYRGALLHLADREAYAITGWPTTELPHLESVLQGALERARATGNLSVPEAVRLLHDYFVVEAMRRFDPYLEALAAEDDQRRYLVDDRAMIRTADGTRIRAIVVRPRAAARPLSTLLEFTILVDARNLARECAAHGYAGVVAFARGRGGSSGTVLPFEHDGSDGHAVVDWIARQPWSDGRVAMYGDGYSGFSAWAVAKQAPAALKAIATADPFAPGIDFPADGGIFHNDAYRWLVQVGADRGAGGAAADRRLDEPARWQALYATWYRNGDPCSDLDGLFGWPSPTLHRWLEHPAYDGYWQAMIPYGAQFGRIDLPVLSMSGYFAAAQSAALYYFEQHARQQPRADHTLLLGPYEGGATRRENPVEADPEDIDPVADLDLRELRYQWFDAVLHGSPRPALLQDRVNVEIIGANAWRHAPSVAALANASMRFYLDPAANGGVHLLAAAPGADAAFVHQRVDLSDRRAGSGSGAGTGAILQKTLPAGNAVVYASEPLAQTIELAGAIAGRFDILPNKSDVDLTLALYEQLPDGRYRALFDPAVEFRASYLADRSQRHLLHRGQRQVLELQSPRLAGQLVQAHNRLVVVLAVNQRPDQEIDYGSGADVRQEFIENAGRPMEIRWFADSYIELPLRSQSPKTTQP